MTDIAAASLLTKLSATIMGSSFAAGSADEEAVDASVVVAVVDSVEVVDASVVVAVVDSGGAEVVVAVEVVEVVVVVVVVEAAVVEVVVVVAVVVGSSASLFGSSGQITRLAGSPASGSRSDWEAAKEATPTAQTATTTSHLRGIIGRGDERERDPEER